ncbi:transposase [Patescibacteria group bacterium]|nr:transposase [Patescibacteria group bacterium]
MGRLKPITDYFYHIYNRGVDKRIIFENNSDYVRFLHLLYACNDKNIGLDNIRKKINVKSPTLNINKNRVPLVDIVCFVLMPNHYHLILKQLEDNGISRFMHRLGTAYTNYFNTKNERTGSLLQGKYKAKYIKADIDLLYLSKYVHLNPIGLIEKDWKDIGICDEKKADKLIREYRWSSYLDYIGIKNFPSIINKEFIVSYYKKPEDYKRFIDSFISGEFEQINHILINVKSPTLNILKEIK